MAALRCLFPYLFLLLFTIFSSLSTVDDASVMSALLAALSPAPSGWSSSKPFCRWTNVNCDPNNNFVTGINLNSQSVSGTLYNFHDPTVYYYGVCYSNEAYWCNNPGCLQPQPYQQAVLPLFSPTVPFISWSCADDLKEEVGENNTEKKRDSRICYRKKGWKTKTRFVPPRFERSQNMVHQGSENTLRQEWKAKKTKSGHGVVSAGAALVSSSIPSTESPIFQHGEKTTVMIRNIPNQYKYTFLLQNSSNHDSFERWVFAIDKPHNNKLWDHETP